MNDPDNAVDRSIMKVAVNIMFNSSSVLQEPYNTILLSYLKQIKQKLRY